MSNNGDERKNDDERNDDNSVRASFTDAELDNALAGFEKEFQEKENLSNTNNEDLLEDSNSNNQENNSIEEAMRGIEEANFEEDLQGLLGNKAKVAMIIAYVEPAKLLAAFCKMANVSARCFSEEQGSVAVLKNLEGNGPEEDVKKFVEFFFGMDVMLITNRADKITAKIYQAVKEPQEIVAPMALAVWSRDVEDLAICMENADSLEKRGLEMFNSDDLSDLEAYKIFQKYGKIN
ncbi:hypothetical protein HXT54_04790 [Gardnerella sp. KA00603]|uniref:Uncharacterized protein n=1 Tax=Gardnerella vaginalis 1500E TaxID=698957 RepID=I4M2D8_GARVA|nr:hypothetical protein [Gardnerella vaginalis]EIK83378.1 hypothetical protein CGSMWGv1500E_02282 [Gardnerella vaginalis 1500E]